MTGKRKVVESDNMKPDPDGLHILLVDDETDYRGNRQLLHPVSSLI